MTPIYLDYQATTPLAPEARAAMEPWLDEKFGNPHSPHRMGREAKAAVAVARDQLSSLLGLRQGHVVFTSGATEAANLALKGAAWAAPAARRKIVTLATEHACVLDTVLWLGSHGFEAEVLPVGREGLVDLDSVRQSVDDRTAIVAAMLVNNEIGVIQPVAEIGRIAREAGALFFCDAVQGLGRTALPDADLIAVSAHKLFGPKGIGALWVRDGVALEPLMHGGAQEAGIRSGTLSSALCSGFGAAAALAQKRYDQDAAHIDRLWSLGTAKLRGWTINGSTEHRYRGNLNVRADGLDAARLISDVRTVAFSAGSACASGSGRPSHVLKAIDLSDAEARSSIRLGFGRYTTEDELDRALDLVLEAAAAQGLKAA
ncbi:aminotransferase class V-fold PLP-dependent enzyme [Sphingomonas sp. MAH-20]|uniref:Cysteine desulfurase n=1 Tax=Sphingomonas horti TaxID=2682842 RepID=A0A6I4IWF5_9SPHN|nr:MULTISPECIES: cysteine desulfurase family protein [Sphingomonas]MBA2920235.1 cysteine desulfurase [Sphingomonas sp. CGMCC 1.13658]MVO76490.1 aminotransferase class V-fold PLP-dependent enzyme [Sphingomonas horti]